MTDEERERLADLRRTGSTEEPSMISRGRLPAGPERWKRYCSYVVVVPVAAAVVTASVGIWLYHAASVR